MAEVAAVIGENAITTDRAKKQLVTAVSALQEIGAKLRAFHKGIRELATEFGRRYAMVF